MATTQAFDNLPDAQDQDFERLPLVLEGFKEFLQTPEAETTAHHLPPQLRAQLATETYEDHAELPLTQEEASACCKSLRTLFYRDQKSLESMAQSEYAKFVSWSTSHKTTVQLFARYWGSPQRLGRFDARPALILGDFESILESSDILAAEVKNPEVESCRNADADHFALPATLGY